MVLGLAKCNIADVKEGMVALAAPDDDLGAVAIEHDEKIRAALCGASRGICVE